MRFTLLGTGTSTGVPTIGCECPTCVSDDGRDKRLRPSLLIESGTTTVVIDTSSDFRQQMMLHGVKRLDAVVFTHHHFDHIGGFDDIRAYNFVLKKYIPIYLLQETSDNIHRTFGYAFKRPAPPGGGVPLVTEHIIDEAPFTIGDITFQPIPLFHGRMRVNGYRIGDFAYCTDTNHIPNESFELLKGVKTLVIDALRYEEHPTHFTVAESLSAIKRIAPERTYLTHIAHQIKHSELEGKLPEGVEIAVDGLVLKM
ncbi:MAG TPA: MBL fold metallo-hydrolase [Patescibacteria group bacterium]|nr:MBL fold metallo-hydrolase [Patescibacteria group bacterium]